MDVQIVVPEISDDFIGAGLRELTSAIEGVEPDAVAFGFLGGSDGYGAHFENDVFVMRPYYWGDCDCGFDALEDAFYDSDAGHTDDCYDTQVQIERRKAGLSWHESRPYRYHEETIKRGWEAMRKAESKIYERLCIKFGLSYPDGCAIHCTCGCKSRWVEWCAKNQHNETCTPNLPNFRHKASGLEVRWYKYIGRGMELKGEGDWTAALFESLTSVKKKAPSEDEALTD